MKDVRCLSISPNVASNFAKKAGKACIIVDDFSNNGAKQACGAPERRVPTSSTGRIYVVDKSSESLRVTLNFIWLTNPQNRDLAPSNFSGRLTFGYKVIMGWRGEGCTDWRLADIEDGLDSSTPNSIDVRSVNSRRDS